VIILSFNVEWVGCNPLNFEANGAVDPKTGVKHVPIAIVNHIMEGTLEGTIQWFNNPEAQASTNYGVGVKGRVVHFVNEGVDRPFANGAYCKETWTKFIERNDGSVVNPNRYTISIEHEGHTGEPFTEEMYQATLWLHKELIQKWGIPIDREHIIGHYQIDGCTRPHCPGDGFPWGRLMTDLKKWEGEMNKVELTWEQKAGLDAVAELAKTGKVNSPETWTAEKMMEPAPTWLVMVLINRINGGK
jgi:N-acetylmuramoyl-L-alanine amidase